MQENMKIHFIPPCQNEKTCWYLLSCKYKFSGADTKPNIANTDSDLMISIIESLA